MLKEKPKKKTKGKQYWIEDQLLAFGFTHDYRGSKYNKDKQASHYSHPQHHTGKCKQRERRKIKQNFPLCLHLPQTWP